jgi:hypothetical protein
MITVETPLKSIEVQRRGLEVLLVSAGALEAQYILGALHTLAWLRHGEDSPLELLNEGVFNAVKADA